MYWYHDGMHWWGIAFMIGGTLLFWALVIAGLVYLARYYDRNRQPVGRAAPPRPSPEELLAERYASGELDDEEYRHRLRTLATRTQ
jgi:putative membrane protein